MPGSMGSLCAPDLQILDNKASAAYKKAITFKWNAKFQLVPPDMHHQNQAEPANSTFKDHFLAILAGEDSAFPPYPWDLLLPQAKLTLNLLWQATLNPRISVWEFFQGPLNFTRLHYVRLGFPSSSMQNKLLGNLGISAQNQVSILALPLIPTADLSESRPTPRAKSSWIPSNFAIHTSPSLCLPQKIRSFTAYRSSWVQSAMHHFQQVFPNLNLLLCFK